MAFSGKNASKTKVVMKGSRCVGPCIAPINTSVPIEDRVRRWSVDTDWDTGLKPKAGDNITIEPNWNMIYDVADANAPILNYLEINGILTFEDGIKDLTLRSNYIFVRAGQLIIGTSTKPF